MNVRVGMLTRQWAGPLWNHSLSIIYLFFTSSIPALGPAQASILMVTGGGGGAWSYVLFPCSRGQLKWDGTSAETRFRLSAKWTSQFKSAEASVQSTTGSRGMRISGSNAGYTMFRGSVKSTGYPLHSLVSPSLPLLCVTVCHHISTGVYTDFKN